MPRASIMSLPESNSAKREWRSLPLPLTVQVLGKRLVKAEKPRRPLASAHMSSEVLRTVQLRPEVPSRGWPPQHCLLFGLHGLGLSLLNYHVIVKCEKEPFAC